VISTVLFGSLIASGIYLMFFYVPSPASAYGNIQTHPDRGRRSASTSATCTAGRPT
jgi:hypothetical protein